jgi:uncharacterized protein YciI
MAFAILQWKGNEMRILCMALLAAAAFAQDAPKHFLIEFAVSSSVDLLHMTQAQMGVFQQHGARLTKLRDEGVVVTGGHTDNPRSMRAIVIIKAQDVAAARVLAEADPAVKAGLLHPTVEAFTLAVPPK